MRVNADGPLSDAQRLHQRDTGDSVLQEADDWAANADVHAAAAVCTRISVQLYATANSYTVPLIVAVVCDHQKGRLASNLHKVTSLPQHQMILRSYTRACIL